MELFDTHAHVLDERFDEDRDEMLLRMREAGVVRAVVVGDAAADLSAAFRFVESREGFWAAAGLHPHDAQKWSEEMKSALRVWMTHAKAVALGEIGLDYHYDLSPRDVQRQVFEAQLDLAFELKKPVILHIREAHGDATEILSTRFRAGRLPAGVMHCYTGSWESAKQYLNMGLYISFSGAVTFKNAPKLAEVAVNMPLERLLVETDCPYMAPVPMRGKRNEPAYVIYTARKLAELRNLPEETLAECATQNGRRLFGCS